MNGGKFGAHKKTLDMQSNNLFNGVQGVVCKMSKRIPSESSNFEDFILRKSYFVDKTKYISDLEKMKFVFLIRPKGFGKSLYLSMLKTYYDIRKKEDFDKYFSFTSIIVKPTFNRGKYLVLYLDFSEIVAHQLPAEQIQENFNAYCLEKIRSFIEYYRGYLSDDLIQEVYSKQSAHEQIETLSAALKDSVTKLYILIDEYDYLTNSLLMNHEIEKYKKITTQPGCFKEFFNTLKKITARKTATLGRLFMVGISPTTINDVTSGSSIGTNISLRPSYNKLLGIAEEELMAVLDYFLPMVKYKISKEQAFNIMKEWYGNHTLCDYLNETIFHTDSVWHFLSELRSEKIVLPDIINDSKITEYAKLRSLILHNDNLLSLLKLIDAGGIVSGVRKSFPYESISKQDSFISLLYFLGFLSFSGKTRKSETFLTVPNEMTLTILYSYIRETIQQILDLKLDLNLLKSYQVDMAFNGNFKPTIEFIGKEIIKHAYHEKLIQNDHSIKSIYIPYLRLYDYFNVDFEPETSNRFADITLTPDFLKYPDYRNVYLIKIRYTDKDSENAIEYKKEEAIEQFNRYSDDERLRKLFGDNYNRSLSLKKIVAVFNNSEIVYCEEQP